MRAYNRYLLCLTVLTGLVNTGLAFSGQESPEVYFIVNSVVYLGITLLFVRLNPRARMVLGVLGCMLFSGVMVIMVVKTVHNVFGS